MTIEIFRSFRAKIISSLANSSILAHAFGGQACDQIVSYALYIIRLVKSSRRQRILYISTSSVESIFITFFLIFLDNDVCILPSDFTISSPLGKKLRASSFFSDSVLVFHHTSPKFSCLTLDCKLLPIPDYKRFIESIHPQFAGLNAFNQYYSVDSCTSYCRVVFTSSGSTGTPKLIPLTVRNINSCFLGCIHSIFSNSAFTHIACFHPCSFVIVLPYLFAFLANKNSTIFGALESSSLFPQYQFRKCLKSTSGTSYLIISVPTVLRVLFDSWNTELRHTYIISCGEPLDIALAKQLVSFKPYQIFNLYGSTEVSPWILSLNILDYFSTFLNLSDIPPILPAGSPLPHATCQVNSSSELLVSSDCVFNGYINDLAEFDNVDGHHFFNTGDLFSFSNGLYFCNGRSNNAVKICGLFVNPIVIEAKLRESFEVDNLICIPEPLLGRLSIYFFQFDKVLNYSEILTSICIKRSLSGYLPDQIILNIVLHKDPPRLLSSGKIDRKSYLCFHS